MFPEGQIPKGAAYFDEQNYHQQQGVTHAGGKSPPRLAPGEISKDVNENNAVNAN